MARSKAFHDLLRAARIARYCDKHGLSTDQGIARLANAADKQRMSKRTRREVLAGFGVTAAAGLLPWRRALAKRTVNVDVGIVGAGIAGLVCADTLRAAGVSAALYEARDRLGGRIWSLGGAFPGPIQFPEQVAERGGEFIDTTHLTMKAYAREFDLALEEVEKGMAPRWGHVLHQWTARA